MGHKTTLAELERQIRAIELRRDGWEYKDIARELGYADESGAWYAVRAALKRAIKEPTEEVKQQELARQDYLWRKTLEVLEKRHVTIQQGRVVTLNDEPIDDDSITLQSIDRALKIQERRANLLGLDAPRRQVLQVIDQNTVDAEIALLEAQLAERADRSDTGESEKADGTSQTDSGETTGTASLVEDSKT